jgi:hypothetical protein
MTIQEYIHKPVSFVLRSYRVTQIFWKSWSHLKILGAIRMTWSKSHYEDPQIWDTMVQNLFAWTTWRLSGPLFEESYKMLQEFDLRVRVWDCSRLVWLISGNWRRETLTAFIKHSSILSTGEIFLHVLLSPKILFMSMCESHLRKKKKGKKFLVVKAYRGSRRIAPLIFILGFRWGWVFNIAPRPLYTRVRTPLHIE